MKPKSSRALPLPGMEASVDLLELLHLPRERPLSPRAELVVRLREFKHKKYLDIRVRELDARGDWRDTGKGVTLRLGELHMLREALRRAECIATGSAA